MDLDRERLVAYLMQSQELWQALKGSPVPFRIHCLNRYLATDEKPTALEFCTILLIAFVCTSLLSLPVAHDS